MSDDLQTLWEPSMSKPVMSDNAARSRHGLNRSWACQFDRHRFCYGTPMEHCACRCHIHADEIKALLAALEAQS